MFGGRAQASLAVVALGVGCLSRDLDTGARCSGDLVCADAGAQGLDARACDACACDACVGGGPAPCCEGEGLGPCAPGHYTGEYVMPSYLPVAAGLCGLLPVFGGSTRGGYAFSLDGERDGGTLVIAPSRSCVDLTVYDDAGSATDGGTLPPVLSLSGTVDCTSGRLEAEVRGYYHTISVCETAKADDFSVKGTMTADYDPVRRAFVGGVIDLHEPGILPGTGEFGGRGTWEAPRTGPARGAAASCDITGRFVDFTIVP
jgi:hypothetical protein